MENAGRTLSRRNLLLAGGGAVAAAGALAAAPFRDLVGEEARALIASQPWARGMLSLADGSYEEWLAQVGSVFAAGGGYGLRLAGVQPLASTGVRPRAVSRERAFLAVFDVTGGGSMAGDLIYTISHPQYGPLPIFLSASTNPNMRGRMLAVFN